MVPPIVLLSWPFLDFAGFELTQAVQHYRTDYGSDNSVPFVGLKPLVVRAYPHVVLGPFNDPDTLSGRYVTGELVLTRHGEIIYRTGPTHASGARIGPVDRIDRRLWDTETTISPFPGVSANWNPPLNFVVPAWKLRSGDMLVSVRIWLTDNPFVAITVSEQVHLINVAPPRISLFRINMTDANGVVHSPSDAELIATTRLAARMLPFPYFETNVLEIEWDKQGSINVSTDIPDEWLDDVAEMNGWTKLFGLGDIIFGIAGGPSLPNPRAGKTVYMGGSAGVCLVGAMPTFAHELGHMYDRLHVDVKDGVTQDDPSYPNYDGDTQSIGEVGVDAGGSPIATKDPAVFDDIMSNGGSRWISPHTYRGILNARDRYATAPAATSKVTPLLVAKFGIHRLGSGVWDLDIGSIHRVDAPGRIEPQRRIAGATPVSVEFISSKDRVLASHLVYPIVSVAGCPGDGGGRGCRCHPSDDAPPAPEPSYRFFAAMAWPEGAVDRLVFVRDGSELGSLSFGEAPEVEISQPIVEDGAVATTIRTRHPQAPVSVVLVFSGDDGASWSPVSINPPEGDVRFPAGRLSGGTRCRFRAIATAELRSAIAETAPFELARRGRRLFVEALPGCGATATLRAGLDCARLGGVPPEDIHWRSDRDGELGRGYDIVVRLSPGPQTLTATAPDGLGGTLSERAIIIVGG